MASNSHIRCWLHIIWSTLHQEKILTEQARRKLSNYLYNYAHEKGIYMKINYVNPDHVHALIDLPANLSIEEFFHLLKGSSSHWINQNDILNRKFAWEKGYAAFSVSHSKMETLEKFIARQEQLHWTMTFEEELNQLINKHNLVPLKAQ